MRTVEFLEGNGLLKGEINCLKHSWNKIAGKSCSGNFSLWYLCFIRRKLTVLEAFVTC